MSADKIQKTARIYALQNAVQFNGKANPKAVVGKVIAALQKNGFPPKEIIPIVNSVTAKINKISLAKQIRGSGPLVVAHGHSHIPSIYKVAEGGVEAVVIDAGTVGRPRAKVCTIMDYQKGELEIVHDCHEKANYVIMDFI